MVVVDEAAIAFPPTRVILSTYVVRIHPVRALVRRPRPVAVMPRITRALGIPITLDPLIVRAGASRHAIRAWRWRLTNANSEGNLRIGRGRGSEEQRRDSECLKEFSHTATMMQSVGQGLFPIAHELFGQCVAVRR